MPTICLVGVIISYGNKFLSYRGRRVIELRAVTARYLDSDGAKRIPDVLPCPSVSIPSGMFCIENLAKLDKSNGGDYDHLGS